MKLQPGEFYAAGMDKLPRIPFDREQEIIALANRIAVAQHADGFRRKFSQKIPKKGLIFSVTFDLETNFYANNMKTKVHVLLLFQDMEIGSAVFATEQTVTCSRNWVS